MPVHDVLAHLLRVRADVVPARLWMRERILDAAAHHAIDPPLNVGRQAPPRDDPAQRNRHPGLRLPELAEIDNLAQPLRLVGEPVLVDDHPRVDAPVHHRPLDVGEEHLDGVARLRERQGEQEVGGREPAGNGDAQAAARDVGGGNGTPRDQQRPAIAAERAAGIEQDVSPGAVRVGVETELGDVDVAREGAMIQRLDVGERHAELEPLEIDAPMHDRVEHEAVVRTGREGERQRHGCSSTCAAASPSATIASAIFHDPRLRRSTTLDTARIWAKRTP